MGIVETNIGDKSLSAWKEKFPKAVKASAQPIKTFSEKDVILAWVREHTEGNSTARLLRASAKDAVVMEWWFELKTDATLFKLTWG